MDNTGIYQAKDFSRDSLSDMSHPVTTAERRRRGYRMIESVEIQNFRGFRQVELKGLPRINVVVGDNGAGKTALLEALFVAAASNPDVVTRFKQWRGVDAAGLTGTSQEIYDGIFLDLFREFQKDHAPSVTLTGNANDSRSVRIYYDQGEPTLLPFGEGPRAPAPISGYTPVSFEWKDAAGQITKITPRLGPSGLQIPQAVPLKRDPAFLPARIPMPTSQNARWFSDFSKWGREKTFISTVQAQFRSVESLTVEVDMGNPVIFVKMPWLDRKIPIYLASDGLNKLVTLLLHLARCEGTALFVDEIENGFHYSRHERLWEQLLSFAEEYETQLFLATHSWEYLKAAVPLIQKFKQEFALIQGFSGERYQQRYCGTWRKRCCCYRSWN